MSLAQNPNPTCIHERTVFDSAFENLEDFAAVYSAPFLYTQYVNRRDL